MNIFWALVSLRKVAGSIPAGVIGIFHGHKILPIALWPWGRLSLEQKWVPGAFPGGKGGRCVRLTTLPPSCAVVMKSGNLNFLEPSGPLQACNGTALPFFSLIIQLRKCERLVSCLLSSKVVMPKKKKLHIVCNGMSSIFVSGFTKKKKTCFRWIYLCSVFINYAVLAAFVGQGIVAWLVRNFLPFAKVSRSLPCWQQPTTWFHSGRDIQFTPLRASCVIVLLTQGISFQLCEI